MCPLPEPFVSIEQAGTTSLNNTDLLAVINLQECPLSEGWYHPYQKLCLLRNVVVVSCTFLLSFVPV